MVGCIWHYTGISKSICTLHNNAEANGIKSAFVAVLFSDTGTGHTLNAFNTTDKELVYVDCTGITGEESLRKWWYRESYATELDKIAYLQKGKEYGLLSIDISKIFVL